MWKKWICNKQRNLQCKRMIQGKEKCERKWDKRKAHEHWGFKSWCAFWLWLAKEHWRQNKQSRAMKSQRKFSNEKWLWCCAVEVCLSVLLVLLSAEKWDDNWPVSFFCCLEEHEIRMRESSVKKINKVTLALHAKKNERALIGKQSWWMDGVCE